MNFSSFMIRSALFPITQNTVKKMSESIPKNSGKFQKQIIDH